MTQAPGFLSFCFFHFRVKSAQDQGSFGVCRVRDPVIWSLAPNYSTYTVLYCTYIHSKYTVHFSHEIVTCYKSPILYSMYI